MSDAVNDDAVCADAVIPMLVPPVIAFFAASIRGLTGMGDGIVYQALWGVATLAGLLPPPQCTFREAVLYSSVSQSLTMPLQAWHIRAHLRAIAGYTLLMTALGSVAVVFGAWMLLHGDPAEVRVFAGWLFCCFSVAMLGGMGCTRVRVLAKRAERSAGVSAPAVGTAVEAGVDAAPAQVSGSDGSCGSGPGEGRCTPAVAAVAPPAPPAAAAVAGSPPAVPSTPLSAKPGPAGGRAAPLTALRIRLQPRDDAGGSVAGTPSSSGASGNGGEGVPCVVKGGGSGEAVRAAAPVAASAALDAAVALSAVAAASASPAATAAAAIVVTAAALETVAAVGGAGHGGAGVPLAAALASGDASASASGGASSSSSSSKRGYAGCDDADGDADDGGGDAATAPSHAAASSEGEERAEGGTSRWSCCALSPSWFPLLSKRYTRCTTLALLLPCSVAGGFLGGMIGAGGPPLMAAYAVLGLQGDVLRSFGIVPSLFLVVRLSMYVFDDTSVFDLSDPTEATTYGLILAGAFGGTVVGNWGRRYVKGEGITILILALVFVASGLFLGVFEDDSIAALYAAIAFGGAGAYAIAALNPTSSVACANAVSGALGRCAAAVRSAVCCLSCHRGGRYATLDTQAVEPGAPV